MAGFRKAAPKQAALKMSAYGAPGTGKTFTACLVAEGLAKLTGKRIAFVDTERGTDFYCQPVPQRSVHPEAFDFDALYTRSLTEVLSELKKLKPEEHGVIVVDSITHLWDAAMAAYSGPKNRAGQIPMHAWTSIKRPYKLLMEFLINCPQHVLILGRQSNAFEENEATGESQAAGTKMRAEKETAHEPHLCFRMESVKPRNQKGIVLGKATPIITAFVEKDRTGILQGQQIEWPNFDNIARPLLGLLGVEQAQIQTEDEAGQQDADALAAQERSKSVASSKQLREIKAKFDLAADLAGVESVGKTITPELKKSMITADVTELRNAYLAARDRVQGVQPATKQQPSEGGEE